MSGTTQTKDSTADADRKAKRRARLRALTGKRTGAAADVAVPDTTGVVSGNAAGSVDVAARRKAIARIYRVLSDTPADENGTVEGTPFTQAGVARLLETLKSRSASGGQAGAKVAAGILKFLSPKDGEAHVHGASLERLQQVAKTAEGRIKPKPAPGAGKGGKRRAT